MTSLAITQLAARTGGELCAIVKWEAPFMRSLRLLASTLVLLALASSAAKARTVSIVAGADLPAPARHGVEVFELAVRARGWEVDRAASADAARGDVIVVAALADAAKTLPSAPALARPLDAPEALAVKKFTLGGRPAVLFAGADARGLMYALLDAAEGIADADAAGAGGAAAGSAANPADFVGAIREVEERPAVR